MYLLTMGWFLAHTSLAMTPEHSATNGEYSSLRSARAAHSKSMCLSSPSVTEPTHTPVARQAQMAALLNRQQQRPTAVYQILCNFAVLMGTSQENGQIDTQNESKIINMFDGWLLPIPVLMKMRF